MGQSAVGGLLRGSSEREFNLKAAGHGMGVGTCFREQ